MSYLATNIKPFAIQIILVNSNSRIQINFPENLLSSKFKNSLKDKKGLGDSQQKIVQSNAST